VARYLANTRRLNTPCASVKHEPRFLVQSVPQRPPDDSTTREHAANEREAMACRALRLVLPPSGSSVTYSLYSGPLRGPRLTLDALLSALPPAQALTAAGIPLIPAAPLHCPTYPCVPPRLYESS
jgi:hypothetical protein